MKSQVKAIVLSILLVSAVAATANNGRNKAQKNRDNQSCLTELPGLTESQAEKIKELETVHQNKMDALRTERRSTTDQNKKDEVRAAMLMQRSAHRTEVEGLLTSDQKEVYAQLHGNGKNQNSGQRSGVSRGSGNRISSGTPQKKYYSNKSQRGSGRGYNQSKSCRR